MTTHPEQSYCPLAWELVRRVAAFELDSAGRIKATLRMYDGTRVMGSGRTHDEALHQLAAALSIPTYTERSSS